MSQLLQPERPGLGVGLRPDRWLPLPRSRRRRRAGGGRRRRRLPQRLAGPGRLTAAPAAPAARSRRPWLLHPVAARARPAAPGRTDALERAAHWTNDTRPGTSQLHTKRAAGSKWEARARPLPAAAAAAAGAKSAIFVQAGVGGYQLKATKYYQLIIFKKYHWPRHIVLPWF